MTFGNPNNSPFQKWVEPNRVYIKALKRTEYNIIDKTTKNCFLPKDLQQRKTNSGSTQTIPEEQIHF